MSVHLRQLRQTHPRSSGLALLDHEPPAIAPLHRQINLLAPSDSRGKSDVFQAVDATRRVAG